MRGSEAGFVSCFGVSGGPGGLGAARRMVAGFGGSGLTSGRGLESSGGASGRVSAIMTGCGGLEGGLGFSYGMAVGGFTVPRVEEHKLW